MLLSILKKFSLPVLFSVLICAESQAQQAMTLKECIAYGLKNHLSVKIYANDIEQSKQKKRESLASYLPQATVSGAVDRNLKIQTNVLNMSSANGAGIPGLPDGNLMIKFGTPYDMTLTGEVTQQIIDETKLISIKASDPYNQLAQLNKQQNDEQIIYNTAAAYFQIIVLQKQLELQEDDKIRYEKLLKVAQLRNQQGVAKKSELMQVQVNLNNLVSQIAVTKNNLSYTINILKNYMGMPSTNEIAFSDTSRWLQTVPENNVVIPEFNYNITTAYLQQKTQIILNDFNRKSIKAGVYPTLAFYARYGMNGLGNSFGQTFGTLYNYSAIGIKLNWNLFTGFRRDAQYRQATVDYENAVHNLKLNEENQNLMFQNSVVSLQRTDSSISSNRSNMRLAREVYENTSLAYQQGASDLSALLNAENSYRESETNYLQSLLDFYQAELALHRSAGTLKEYFNQL
ncbi:MAG: TolC family protein [Chitinophagaceae bacterium]|jgi:outer membrane protein TolC|nr:TolC family protein [Chitinophagaceae bacterium]